MLIRLDKYLANMNVGTRTEVKALIKKGLVMVENQVIKKPDLKINDSDQVIVNGEQINFAEYEYFMLNKPQGVISATQDKKERTVIDLISEKKRKDLFPVGRLDKDTEGLLLITNDGDLAHNLLSPKKHVDKVYYAKINGRVTNSDVEIFLNGVDIGEKEITRPAKLVIISESEISEVYITIKEGKFHQIKRMFHAVDKEVVFLKRLSMGTLKLDKALRPGEYRLLTKEEIELLKGENLSC